MRALFVFAIIWLLVPSAARADCDVSESGVAEDAIPMRKALAENGIAIGGYYAAETFGNPTGGFKQGATYDGVLEVHVNADLEKLGLWKGLCFYTDAFQIHGRSITAIKACLVGTRDGRQIYDQPALHSWLESNHYPSATSRRSPILPQQGKSPRCQSLRER